jgi:xanthine dehydrogenase accessory factor
LSGQTEIPAAIARKARRMAPGAVPLTIDGWLIEAATPRAKILLIYGAGHVGRALVDVLYPLPGLAITWVDTAENRFPEQIPDGVTRLVAADPALAARHAPAGADHLILTYSHALDLALCDTLLRQSCASIGLIGSATKWARFRSRLAALGHGQEQISRIACPIGDPGLGKHPQAIALGVATSLLRQAQTQSSKGTENDSRYSA